MPLRTAPELFERPTLSGASWRSSTAWNTPYELRVSIERRSAGVRPHVDSRNGAIHGRPERPGPAGHLRGCVSASSSRSRAVGSGRRIALSCPPAAARGIRRGEAAGVRLRAAGTPYRRPGPSSGRLSRRPADFDRCRRGRARPVRSEAAGRWPTGSCRRPGAGRPGGALRP